ncbi:hypothetical protein [Catellatospora coxensis]|uniref:Uncharacterized protein n=1 Tax=Catellatospora coxensis TaxID=310354 RepID=A0A8J3PBF7_9ACTN|nr:hypothetical protein [Catellatospora coxensis]GIG10353.1 hypothetical protein Cco03nite_70530 [Catellatospora coxensis]
MSDTGILLVAPCGAVLALAVYALFHTTAQRRTNPRDPVVEQAIMEAALRREAEQQAAAQTARSRRTGRRAAERGTSNQADGPAYDAGFGNPR